MKKRGKRVTKSMHLRQPVPAVVAWQQFLTSLPPPLRTLAMRVHQRQPPCLLCQAPFHALGMFLPNEPQRWGITEGWAGGCVYALCQACVTLPDRTEQVEAVLWQDRQRQAVAQWN